MPRTGLTSSFTEAALNRETSFLVLQTAEITHTDLDPPLRFVNNVEDISVNGVVYTAVGFDLVLPEEKDEGFSRASITINNADQWFTSTLRSLSGEFKIEIALVSATDESADPPEFNEVEVSFLPMRILDIEYDAMKVVGNLSYESVADKRFPNDSFDPYNFPGLF